MTMTNDNPQILVVDDEAFFRKTITEYLGDEGFRCLEASNGREAIECINNDRVDLMLLDLRMPVMSGIETLERIEAEGLNIPTIVLSGTGDMQDVVRVLQLGACDYILKPLEELRLLLTSITRALREAQLARENQQYREHLEELVDQRTAELETAMQALEEKNIAMREVLLAIQNEKQSVARSVGEKVDKVILPMLATLKPSLDRRQGRIIDRLEDELKDLDLSSGDEIGRQFTNLSPTELRICHHIRRGLSAKEIAVVEGVSSHTVQTHRRNIRKKLEIRGTTVNLANFLGQYFTETDIEE